MRTIKFRAWDKNEREMFDWISIRPNLPISTLNEKDGAYEWMQFTGRTGKNGKEIYEGDIVENNGTRWEIYWHDINACYCMVVCGKERSTNNPLFIGEAEHSEVIGNIYENPELLN